MADVFGTMFNHVLSIANGAVGEYDMSELVKTEKRLLLVPESGAVLHLLLTPASSENDADANDLLIPSDGLDLVVGRSMDRISVYNATGSTKKLYIGILY